MQAFFKFFFFLNLRPQTTLQKQEIKKINPNHNWHKSSQSLTCTDSLGGGHLKKGTSVELLLLLRGLATKLDLRHQWKRLYQLTSVPFHNPNKALCGAAEREGGGGCSDTCMMRAVKTKGHEASSRLQLTVPLAGASPLSFFFSFSFSFSTSTSFFSFSSYKICPEYARISIGEEFIVKCNTVCEL